MKRHLLVSALGAACLLASFNADARDARMHVGYAFPFRDGKGSTWEGGHRVPGIFYWPGTIKPHTVIQDPASTLDIFPTLIEVDRRKAAEGSPYRWPRHQPVFTWLGTDREAV